MTSATSKKRVGRHVRGGSAWWRRKNRRKNVKSSRRKFAFVRRLRNVKRPRPVKQTKKGRGRGLVGPRKPSRMPSERGNTPVVLSRPGVLDLECITQKLNFYFLIH